MKLFIIRHLATSYNQQKLLQGSIDKPILEPSKNDLEKINQNKLRLESFKPFNQVLVSKLIRTRMTAQAYGFNDEIKVEPLLSELNFGCFEGGSKSTLLEQHADVWINHPQNLILGEPLKQLETRVLTFLQKYKNENSVLIFGHGSWLRALHSIIQLGNISEMNKISIPNNQLLTFELN